MAPSEGHPLRFGIVTDIHYTPDEQAGTTPAGLTRCINRWQEQKTAFVVQLGDLVSREGDAAFCDLVEVRGMLARYPGPMVHVPGNHCLAVPQERLFSIMGIPAPYYAFATGGIRFIVLHSMDVSMLSEPENTADSNLLAYYRDVRQALFYCGAVGSRQLEWLVGELDSALRNEEPVIVLSHLPLLEETTDAKHGLLWNHEEVSALISRYPNVRACFSGHFHPGGYALRDGIHFIVLPAFAGGCEQPCFCCGTVEIGDGRLRILSLDGNTLHDLEFFV
ncbi:MAG: metallophosphoesterase [Chlorobiaceae bacterium]|nr:metallophosphoesterase [Chlorobiaceae bacterium]